MKKQVERYAVSISLLFRKYFEETNTTNLSTINLSYDIDGEEELVKLIKHYNYIDYRMTINNCGEGNYEYTAKMAIDKIDKIIKLMKYEKETC